jgi:hypothetical protein
MIPSSRPAKYPRFRASAAAAFTLLLLASPAFAVTLNYTLAGGSVTADNAEPGLVIGTMVKPTVAGTSFSLADGGSFTFSFFDIWTDEPKIDGDDKVASPISATLNFTDPFTGATVSGITVGGSWMQGLSQWGTLTWNGPVTVAISGDRTFQISLSDAEFNYGFGGLNEGMMCGATVSATITQITSQTPPGDRPGSQVPEGGKTAFLLGGALTALRFIAKNRRSVRGWHLPISTGRPLLRQRSKTAYGSSRH